MDLFTVSGTIFQNNFWSRKDRSGGRVPVILIRRSLRFHSLCIYVKRVYRRKPDFRSFQSAPPSPKCLYLSFLSSVHTRTVIPAIAHRGHHRVVLLQRTQSHPVIWLDARQPLAADPGADRSNSHIPLYHSPPLNRDSYFIRFDNISHPLVRRLMPVHKL
jgi:hypothetical protein